MASPEDFITRPKMIKNRSSQSVNIPLILGAGSADSAVANEYEWSHSLASPASDTMSSSYLELSMFRENMLISSDESNDEASDDGGEASLLFCYITVVYCCYH